MNIDDVLKLKAFDLVGGTKNKIFLDKIKALTLHHYQNCDEYKKIIKGLKINLKSIHKIEDYPMIPTKVFKKFNLMSVSKNKIVKKLVSSGTSGKLSAIYLDQKNASNQTKVLKKIISTILGETRLPMLIIDQNPKLLDRSTFNARAAAIYGFSIFGKNHHFLLSEKGKIDYEGINNFLKKFGSDKFFIFGFTSLIYENLILNFKNRSINSNLKNGILLHGGGWKKMEKIGVSNNEFKKKLFNKTRIKNVYNYYGLVEQTGSIFIDCKKCGNFITSSFSDVLIRNKKFELEKTGKKGLVQLISLLPTSYPGHNILTEDIGEIVGQEKCDLKGKHFKLYGRAKEAEIRGCSDAR